MKARYYSGLLRPEATLGQDLAARRQRGDSLPPGLHHLRGRPDRRHDVLDSVGGLRSPGREPLSFVSGSHRAGVMDGYTTYGGNDALEVFPVARPETGERMTYALGDATPCTPISPSTAPART